MRLNAGFSAFPVRAVYIGTASVRPYLPTSSACYISLNYYQLPYPDPVCNMRVARVNGGWTCAPFPAASNAALFCYPSPRTAYLPDLHRMAVTAGRLFQIRALPGFIVLPAYVLRAAAPHALLYATPVTGMAGTALCTQYPTCQPAC